MSNKKLSFEAFKEQAFKSESFRQEYSRLQSEFDLVSQLIIARKKSKISQSELAVKLHTKQPAIARFENGGFERSSIFKLQEYAAALGYGLHISLIRKSPDQQVQR